jgi:hypothetical protein
MKADFLHATSVALVVADFFHREAEFSDNLLEWDASFRVQAKVIA